MNDKNIIKEYNNLTDNLIEKIKLVNTVDEKISIIKVALYDLVLIYLKNTDKHSFAIAKELILPMLITDKKEEINNIYLFLLQELKEENYINESIYLTEDKRFFVFDNSHNIVVNDKYGFFDKYLSRQFAFNGMAIPPLGELIWSKMDEVNLLDNLLDVLYKEADVIEFYENEYNISPKTIDTIDLYNNILFDMYMEDWDYIFEDIIDKTEAIKTYYNIDMDSFTHHIIDMNKDSKISLTINTDVDKTYNNYTYDIPLYDKNIGGVLDMFSIADASKYEHFISKVDNCSDINLVVEGIPYGLKYVDHKNYKTIILKLEDVSTYIKYNDDILVLPSIDNSFMSIDTSKVNIDIVK